MKKIIYYISIIILLILISIIPTSAKEIKTCTRTTSNLHISSDITVDNNLNDILTTPCVDNSVKVYDFADLLTDSEEELLYDEVNNYINKNNYDLAIVTISTNNKNNSQDYADDFYDYNSFGISNTKDGVLILIDMDKRYVYISTTGYAIKMYDDKRIDSIIDSGYDYLKNENYYETFSQMISKLDYYYDLDFPKSNSNLIISSDGSVSYILKVPYEFIFVLSLIITLIVSLILYFKSKLKLKTPSTINYLKKGKITVRSDNFINSVVTHVRRSESNYSSGGSSHGGSHTHTSSSGSSHGGGGRHF